MSQGPRYPFAYMRSVADALWQYLATSVVRHDIAGSVRRIAAQPRPHPADTCGDIELVLDADPACIRAKLLARPGVVQHITGGTRLLKCEIVTRRKHIIPVQLHFATTLHTLDAGTVNNYGYKLLLATGDAEWNRLVMQPRRSSGLLPAHLHFVEERFPSHGFPHTQNFPVHVPTEADVFKAWGLPYVPPHRRNEITVRELRATLHMQGIWT